MLTLIITPRRGLYPSLASFDEHKGLCYDLRGRHDAIICLNRQVVCFNWGVQEKMTLQVTKSFVKRCDVKQVLSKLRRHPYEIIEVGLDESSELCFMEKPDPVNDLLTQFGNPDVHPADIAEAIRESRRAKRAKQDD